MSAPLAHAGPVGNLFGSNGSTLHCTDCPPTRIRAHVLPCVFWQHATQPVQVPAASEIPPFLSDWGSLPGSTVNDTSSSLRHSSLIPRCAMNPAYEYALPTQVARLMAGPCVKTEHVGANGFDAASPIHSQPGGCRGRVPWLQSPMLAATQPLNAASLRSGAMPIGGSCSSSGRYGSISRTNLAPVYSSRHSGNPQESLGAHSNAVGSTIVMSPYMPNGRSACMLTRCTHEQSAIGSTIVSTRSWDDAETPPPPPPQQQDVFGINMGGLRDTVGTRDSARIHGPVRAQNRQWWQRMWLPAAVQTPPDDSTVNSAQSAQQLLARLQRQLDGFRTDDLFLMRFEMLGAQTRRRGGALPGLLYFPPGCSSDVAAFISPRMCVLKSFMSWYDIVSTASTIADRTAPLRTRSDMHTCAHQVNANSPTEGLLLVTSAAPQCEGVAIGPEACLSCVHLLCTVTTSNEETGVYCF